MSAESPRKSNRQGGHVVAPQPVSDRSIIESVAGFINEVVPQAYTSAPLGEGKEAITWARFEYGDINDPALYPDSADDRNGSPPLLLVLGYGSGVQVWAVPASGEATEVLSWRQGVVRTLRILPTPGTDAGVPDAFSHTRPLVAMCDCAGGPAPQFCSLSFISLRTGDQVKSIKFKNPVSDVLANRRSVVVTFPERIAVFDASTLEDRLTVTTCYPCPGPNPNPVALGSRWLAYSERRLMPARRSSGGTEGEGVQSYTATVLHAAKSFGKGLRELGETVASSLTGGGAGVGMQRGMVGGVVGQMSGQQVGNVMIGNADTVQSGVVTIIDAQGTSSSGRGEESRDSVIGGSSSSDNVIAHFMAHSEPIVALAFDPSGMLLLTADKRGHDFHVFRIHPHPGGPSLAAVHHLYVLHRGDTTAKVQDIAFAADSRWVAVSTLRGTTHVFPITPYGGSVGIRTHATPHVVNRLSRFHRSAGLTADGRNSPIPTAVSETVSTPPAMPYPNPRLPPYSHPTVISPLAQIRQPTTHTLLSASTPTSLNPASQQSYHRNPSMRSLGRTQSSSDDGLPGGGIPLRVTACFAPPRAWLIGSPTVPRETSAKAHKRAVDSLFVMACHGNLIEYDLEPKHAAGIPKEKVCDDTAIELDVQPKAQWMLLRPPHSSELQPPLSSTNPLMVLPDRLPTPTSCESRQDDSDSDERWLSQVEIVTHAGPHRRLWMGPQFTFKTYNSAVSGVPLSLLELEAVEVGVGSGSRPARSNPVNMPVSSGSRPVVPVLIESGSGSSYEQSPRLLEAYGTDGVDSDGSAGPGETQLREDLADAMMESPGVPTRDTGRRVIVEMQHGARLGKKSSNPIQKVVNPVGTVITVSFPSEEEGASQASDINVTVPMECESSVEEDGGVKWPSSMKSTAGRPKSGKELSCLQNDPLQRCSTKDSSSVDDINVEPTVKWPAVAKAAPFSKSLTAHIKSRLKDGHLESYVSGHDSVIKSMNKESEIRTQRKSKGNVQTLSAKRYNKVQIEENDERKCVKGEDRIEHNVTVGEVEPTERRMPWRTQALKNGPFTFTTNVKEKDCDVRKGNEIESKFNFPKNLPPKSNHTGVEGIVKEEMDFISSKEVETKSVKSKAQLSLKVKDGNNGNSKIKSSLYKTVIPDELNVQGSFRKDKNLKHDDIVSEATLKQNEMKYSETKNSKRSTKHKFSSNTMEEACETSLNDESHICLEEESKSCKPSVSKLSELDVVSKSIASDISNSKEKPFKLQTQNIEDDFDISSSSSNLNIIKKQSLRNKSRGSKISKCLLLEDLFTEPDSEASRDSIDETGCSLVSLQKNETQKSSSSLLHERFSEHHFGTEEDSSHDTFGISNLDMSICESFSHKPNLHSEFVVEEKTKYLTKQILEKKSSKSNVEQEVISEGGSQENLVFKSTFDEVYVPPPKSWSSIVSSSNRNKSPVKETVAQTNSETVFFKFEEFRISPQCSWSDVASSVPKDSADQTQFETTSDTNFECRKVPEDVDDFSDDGEDKVTVDSNKSQSSDRTSCSEMVTASESLSTVATSESSAATGGNEEDSCQLNEENGNEEELPENGEASSTTASQGANKKSRRAKKKRR